MSQTAVVSISGYSTIDDLEHGNACFSLYWGVDHPKNYEASLNGYHNINHVEMHAAREAIKTAAKLKFSRIVIRTASRFTFDLTRNSANFVNAPEEIRHLVQSIQSYKEKIIVKVELKTKNSGVQVDHNESMEVEDEKENS